MSTNLFRLILRIARMNARNQMPLDHQIVVFGPPDGDIRPRLVE